MLFGGVFLICLLTFQVISRLQQYGVIVFLADISMVESYGLWPAFLIVMGHGAVAELCFLTTLQILYLNITLSPFSASILERKSFGFISGLGIAPIILLHGTLCG